MSKPTQNLDYYPNVAVIIAVYNNEAYIEESIMSAVNQDYVNKIVMVYCDGCTDNTASVARKCAKDNKGVHVIECETNAGLSHGRNTLVNLALGIDCEYIVILDGDDYFHDTSKITQMVRAAISAPKMIGVVYTDYQNYHMTTGKFVREYKRGFSRDELVRECILSDSGTMVSALAYKTVGTYDETLKVGMDYDLWLRISEKFLIYHIPECTTTVRITDKSLSKNPLNKEIWSENISRVYSKLRERQMGKR